MSRGCGSRAGVRTRARRSPARGGLRGGPRRRFRSPRGTFRAHAFPGRYPRPVATHPPQGRSVSYPSGRAPPARSPRHIVFELFDGLLDQLELTIENDKLEWSKKPRGGDIPKINGPLLGNDGPGPDGDDDPRWGRSGAAAGSGVPPARPQTVRGGDVRLLFPHSRWCRTTTSVE
jgi:hypothetical protein